MGKKLSRFFLLFLLTAQSVGATEQETISQKILLTVKIASLVGLTTAIVAAIQSLSKKRLEKIKSTILQKLVAASSFLKGVFESLGTIGK